MQNKKKQHQRQLWARTFPLLLLSLFCVPGAQAQLSGTYTINGSQAASSTNYQTFASAVSDMVSGTRADGGTVNGKGVSGAVVFNVANGTYVEQITIRPVNGASATNTITFQSASGDSSKATLAYPSSTSSTNNFTLLIDSADFLVFKELGIQRTGTNAYGTVVMMKGGAHKNTFIQNRIRGVYTTSAAVDQALLYSPGDADTGNVFLRNSLSWGSKGIYQLGASIITPETGTIVQGNHIDSVADDQIWLSYQSNPLIRENLVTNIAAATSYGITLENSINGARILKNKLLGPIGTYGIYLNSSEGASASNRGIVANNFISIGGIGGAAGIYVNGSSYFNFYYNSVSISSNSNTVRALYINTASSVSGSNQFYNNIFANTGGGLAVEVTPNAVSSNMISASNYNDIYSSGSTLAKLGTTNIADLVALRSASGMDANSVSADPKFISTTDLHTRTVTLNGKATPLSLITDDIDGDTRSTTAPDIGADEFTPVSTDIRTHVILGPQSNGCGDSTTALAVVIVNEGTGSQSNFTVGANISGSTSQNLSQSYTKSLASGARDTLVFSSTFNTFAGGTFNVTAYTSLSGDMNRSNDTISDSYTILPIPTAPTLTGAQKCGPGSLKLTAAAGTGETIEWFTTSTASTPVFRGDTFTTPALSSTTTYYAQKVLTFGKKDAVTTTFAAGSGQQGNMFDIVTINSIAIDSFDVHVQGNTPDTVEIYYKKGTFVGFESSAGSWTLLGSYGIIPAGSGNPTKVKIGGLTIPAGETYGMYVRLKNSTNMRYTVGADTVTNADLSIQLGKGVAGYFGGTFNPRTWNGRIYYRSRSCPSKRLAVKAVIDPKPTGASLSQGTVFQGKFNTGTSFDRDVVCVGGTVQYALQPPTGYSNSDYGTLWNVTSLTFKTSKGSSPSTGVSITNPTTTSAGSLDYTSSSAFEDSILIMGVTIQNMITGCDSSFSRYLYVAPQPKADFSFMDVCAGGAVTFTDKSTISKGTFSYSWDFGDGNTSKSKNPAHQFSQPGTYQVKLKVISFWGCMDSIEKTVNVSPSPVAGFSAADVCLGQNVNFTNNSNINAGSITSHSWDFGDGNKSTAMAPSHSFASSGAYSVKLVVTSDKGCKDSLTKTVTVHPAPKAGFTTANVCGTDSVRFTNTTTMTPSGTINYFWEFGDGGTSLSDNPAHKYAAPGTYTVKLTAETQNQCSDMITKQVTVHPVPVAKAGILSNTFCAGTSAMFIDSSSIIGGSIASRAWEFGDGNKSSLANPSHTYASTGTFTVKLTVTSNNGCTATTSRVITVNDKPSAQFTATTVCQGEATTFTNTSTSSPNSTYFWSFGDGDTSTAMNPSHTYTNAGTFSAILAVRNESGCIDTMRKSVIVNALPDAGFTVTIDSGRKVTFTPAENNHNLYQWKFGNGATSTQVSPVYTYIKDGDYQVTLKVFSKEGCVSEYDTTININTVGLAEVKAPALNIDVAPNPFTAATQISYALDKTAKVKVSVYDLSGKEVTVLAEQNQSAGKYSYSLDADALKMKAGIYLLRITVDNALTTKQIIRLK